MIFSVTVLAWLIPHQPLVESRYLPPNLFLVRAKTLSVADLMYHRRRGKLKVAQVYLGPARLVGEEFECETTGIGMHLGAYGPKIMFFERDVEGLWWIRHDDSGTLQPELRAEVIEEFGIRQFPIQKHRSQWFNLSGQPVDVEARFRPPLAWAAAIESVGKAKFDEERAKLLRQMAKGDDPFLSHWSIALLARARKPEDIALLRELAEAVEFSGTRQPQIDEILCRLDRDNWLRSPSRQRMIGRWLDSRANWVLMSHGSLRLYWACRDDLSPERYLDALDRAFSSSNGYSAAQFKAVAVLLQHPPRANAEDSQRIFGILITQTESGADPEVRRSAASGLFHMARGCVLNDAQEQRIRDLRDKSKERAVFVGLTNAVNLIDAIKGTMPPPGAPMAQPNAPIVPGHRREPPWTANPEPEFVRISAIDRALGRIKLTQFQAVPGQRHESRVEIVDGRPVTRVVIVNDTRFVMQETIWPLASLRVLTADGKELTGDAAWKELTLDRTVVRARTAEPLDAAYLKLLAKDTLVLMPR